MGDKLRRVCVLASLAASCSIDRHFTVYEVTVHGTGNLDGDRTATVTVELAPPLEEAALLLLGDSPFGLGADPVTLPVGSTGGQLILHADDGAFIDSSLSVTVAASTGGVTAQIWASSGFATGTLDPTFGDRGETTIPFDGDCSRFMIAQPDGKLLFPVIHDTAPGQLLRLTSDGRLDEAFGANGLVTLDGTAGGAADVLVREDGSLVAIGRDTSPSLGMRALLWRLSADATTTSTVDLGARAVFSAIAASADEIFVAGTSVRTGAWAGARLDPGGNLDPQYGDQGLVELEFTAEQAAAGQGAWLLAGSNPTGVGELATLSPDGTVSASLRSTDALEYMSPLVTGGQVYVMSERASSVFLGRQVIVQRLRPDLSVDPNFGVGGAPYVTAPPGVLRLSAVQSDGKIVIVRAPTWVGAVQVLRLNADGTPDPTVRVDVGLLVGEQPHESTDPIVCLGDALDAQGRLIVAYKYASDAGSAHVVRIHL